MSGLKTKFIPLMLILGILGPALLFAAPKKADAFWGILDFGFHSDVSTEVSTGATAGSTATGAAANTASLGQQLKDAAKEIQRQVLMAIARKVLQEMTKSTVNWINSGFHGNPLYLPNPESFFKDIQKYEVRTLIDAFGYDPTKFPFGKQWALGVINSYKGTLENNASYSLSEALQDPVLVKNYQENFSVGGWDGFLINTQYPQNNPIGFRMLATEELARRIAGTEQTKIQQVNATLAQGQGFLSPKKCTTNENYNDGFNEFKQPAFSESQYLKDHPYNPPTESPECKQDPLGEACQRKLTGYDTEWQGHHNDAKRNWFGEKGCPNKPDGTSGFAATTPGSVVANQIMQTMSSSVRQTELGAALGNSLSAVFDALLNHFLDQGLTALASKVNPPPKGDDWNYNGLTLGGPGEGGTNVTWDAGPDEPVIVDEFKKKLEGRTIVTSTDDAGAEVTEEQIGNTGNGEYIAGDIANTQAELKLMYNDVAVSIDPATGGVKDGPGIFQMFSAVWPKGRDLDICLPGPDVGWQDRLKNEVDRNTKKLQSLLASGSSSGDPDAVLKELDFAVKFFQDWVENKMLTSLPNSIMYMDAVNDVHELAKESNDITTAQRTKRQALARLQAIDSALAAFHDQPATGSAGEKALVSLWKQYKAVQPDASSSISVENTRNELSTEKDRYVNLTRLTAQCSSERKAAGWGLPGGKTSSWSGTAPAVNTNDDKTKKALAGLEPNSEQALFCNLPISTGYTHEMFIGPGTAAPQLPMVNAEKVIGYKVMTIKSMFHLTGNLLSFSNKKQAYVNIQLSCNKIFNANILDYKGDLPGATNITVSEPAGADDTGTADMGVCTFPDDGEGEALSDIIMTQADCEANNGEWEQIAPPGTIQQTLQP